MIETRRESINAPRGTALDQPATTPDDQRVDMRRVPLAGLAALVGAITADFAIYRIARAAGAIPNDLPAGAEQIGMPAIITVCVLTIVVATVALALFARFSTHPIRNFTILAAIVFVTSVQAPLGIEDASTGLIISLLVMHAATALIAWLALTRLARVS